jgi:hypothetical protein
MKLRGGEFSTGTTGIFQPELTVGPGSLSRFPPSRPCEACHAALASGIRSYKQADSEAGRGDYGAFYGIRDRRILGDLDPQRLLTLEHFDGRLPKLSVLGPSSPLAASPQTSNVGSSVARVRTLWSSTKRIRVFTLT